MKIRIYLLASLAFLLVGCDSPRLNPLSANDVVLAFGDSLTVGVGTSDENSYPRALCNHGRRI